MVKTVAKGYRTEKRCVDELKEQGYIIWKTIRVQFQNIDLFGLFDIVALHPEGKYIRFIQCKTNRCDKQTRERIKELKMPDKCQKEIWIWKDRIGWEKKAY